MTRRTNADWSYDPRLNDDLPQWSLGAWLLTTLAVAGVLLSIVAGIWVYVAVFG